MDIITNAKHIYFIGIGGIGVSAIAKMMLLSGKKVSGSDRDASVITEKLKNEGAQISIGQKRENIERGVDLVIYTIAISEDNPELMEAKKRGIPCITYPEALGEISKHKKTIAISGTHGKTTTTAMIAHIALSQQLHPTVVVGSLMKGKENFIGGNGEYFIVEACEYKRSFLNLSPYILVITNIEEDHLDYYQDLNDIISAFQTLAEKVPSEGAIVCDTNNKNIREAIKNARAKIIDYTAIALSQNILHGEHNRKNARAALAVFSYLGFQTKDLEPVVGSFQGTWRRQEYKGKTKTGALIYDDYAHHPTEIKATLQAMREIYPDKKISILFQPHLYSRTKSFLEGFAKELSRADQVVITDIYAAREKNDGNISGEILAEKINTITHNVLYIKTFDEIIEKINIISGGNDVVLTMGAGDIYKVGEKLIV